MPGTADSLGCSQPQHFYSEDDTAPVHAAAMIPVDDDIPTTLRQAFKSHESAHWQKAVDSELSALVSKQVWIETPLPIMAKNVRPNASIPPFASISIKPSASSPKSHLM
ncbi:hypothetical protein CCMA1212_009814 [Trichoderma ghanense]|uniref:Uncharacterized protein n=1 Tax=Trichoderma ghanense TaxID=65468 RepID=A0ABY2GS41_9HYPO